MRHADELLTLLCDDDELDVVDTAASTMRAAVARALRTLLGSIAERGKAVLEVTNPTFRGVSRERLMVARNGGLYRRRFDRRTTPRHDRGKSRHRS